MGGWASQTIPEEKTIWAEFWKSQQVHQHGLGIWPEGTYQKLKASGGSADRDLEAELWNNTTWDETLQQPEETWFYSNNTNTFMSLIKSSRIKHLKMKYCET